MINTRALHANRSAVRFHNVLGKRQPGTVLALVLFLEIVIRKVERRPQW